MTNINIRFYNYFSDNPKLGLLGKLIIEFCNFVTVINPYLDFLYGFRVFNNFKAGLQKNHFD